MKPLINIKTEDEDTDPKEINIFSNIKSESILKYTNYIPIFSNLPKKSTKYNTNEFTNKNITDSINTTTDPYNKNMTIDPYNKDITTDSYNKDITTDLYNKDITTDPYNKYSRNKSYNISDRDNKYNRNNIKICKYCKSEDHTIDECDRICTKDCILKYKHKIRNCPMNYPCMICQNYKHQAIFCDISCKNKECIDNLIYHSREMCYHKYNNKRKSYFEENIIKKKQDYSCSFCNLKGHLVNECVSLCGVKVCIDKKNYHIMRSCPYTTPCFICNKTDHYGYDCISLCREYKCLLSYNYHHKISCKK